jgi:glycosyltransferase involved in cell wall biosynthesis
MTIIQITPGAGAMYCGNCFRDNALVKQLRKLGHDVLMLPVYLPLTLDEEDQSAGVPIFFSGINVYLGQKSALYRNAPGWLRNALASPKLLKWAGGRTASTRAADLGEITISMLRGEEGNQARELDEMIAWLKTQPSPDVICLSNALLVGMARRLKTELRAPVVCTLQGEDCFLDALPEPDRTRAWQMLSQRARDVDLFIAPSRYFADLMSGRIGLGDGRVRVVFNGINLDGFRDGEQRSPTSSLVTRHSSPVVGYFARMCKEKGLDVLVDAFIEVRRRGRVPNAKLRVGGGCGPTDEPFVASLKERLQQAGILQDAEFHPNLNRPEKIDFLKSLSVFSVPAPYGEAFGLYLIEALAAGVPIVQPRSAAFPEVVQATGGGLVCEPSSTALADGIESLLADPARARELAATGQRTVFEKFSAHAMAEGMLRAFKGVVRKENGIANRAS